MNSGLSFSILSQRKSKRLVPDSNKDNKYWEKRKRNNLAAKRSRENKRKVEIETRSRVFELEQENALLKKELAVIKAKFGVSSEKTFLTTEEKVKCMSEMRKSQMRSNDFSPIYQERAPSDDDENDKDDDRFDSPGPLTETRSSANRIREEGYRQSPKNSCRYGYNSQPNMAMYAPFNSMMWATASPGGAVYSPMADMQTEVEPKDNTNLSPQINRCNYTNFQSIPERIFTQPPFQYYVPYSSQTSSLYPCNVGGSAQYPATNLTMKPTSDVTGTYVGEIKEEPRENNDLQSSQMNFGECGKSLNAQSQTDNQKLKMKLMHLSAQVEEMKSLMMKQ